MPTRRWIRRSAQALAPLAGRDRQVAAADLGVDAVDVSETGDPQAAIGLVDTAIDSVVDARNTMGSFQRNSLESQANYLQLASENMTAARSIFVDADFAVEVAAFTRQQILMQSGMQVLSSAGQFPQLVLGLLQ